jgi:pyruvate/2-oxoglutarate/acetoin dehydrogenase E1 component
MLYLESLNQSLHNILKADKNVILLGEDILDPYGGAFKVTKGLSTEYPDQVISTPISEAGVVGCAVGMSMRSLKPIVEMMFGDFITLAVDQIINHASKYNWIYNNKVNVPILIRTPTGGGRGYGPTHSQSLESIFMSVSGIEIIAPSLCHDPGQMMEKILKSIQKPTIFIEYKTDYAKKLYDEQINDFSIERDYIGDYNQNITLSLYPKLIPDVLIITYGGNLSITIEAAKKVFLEEEILTNVLLLSSVRPIDEEWIINKVRECGKIVVVEEGNKIGGWSAEVASVIQEKAFNSLKCPIQRIGALDIPIPSSGLMEKKVLPSAENIIETIIRISVL